MIQNFLMPGGIPLGVAGSGDDIRELPGGLKDAQDLFDDLTHGATQVDNPTYPGRLFRLPGGGTVGMRSTAKSGPPTIDVNVPGKPIIKIKFI